MSWDGAGSLFALGLRLTKLDAAGRPVPGLRSCYVTDSLVTVNLGLAWSEPDAVELMNGRGQTCVYYQPPPTILTGMIEELKVCTPDPNILEFLTGGEIITDGGVNEVQTVTVTGATGGTFTLTFSGQTTGAIAHNATASAVTNALTSLSNVNPGDVNTSGTGPYVITFGGQYAAQNVPAMTASATNLTGTGTPTAVVAETTAGAAGDAAIGWRAPAVNVDPIPNGVAIEAWSNALRNNVFDPLLPYYHWVVPRAKVRPSEAMTLGAEDPATPQMEGTTEENEMFGDGPLSDISFPTSRVWQFCRVATMPELTPGFVEVPTP